MTGTARTTYTLDSISQRTKKDTPTATTFYSWDAVHNLTQVVPVGSPVTMTYDADARRATKTVAADTKKFLYDYEKLLQEADGSDNVQHTYTQSEKPYGDLVSQYDGSTTLYHQFDGVGSTDALINDSESATDRYAYRAFGLDTHTSGSTSQPLTFVGESGYYRDNEIDLYLVRRRYYDFATGRFVSEDPLGYRAGDINLFRYVGNNPVNQIDPSGLQSLPTIPYGYFLVGGSLATSQAACLAAMANGPPYGDAAMKLTAASTWVVDNANEIGSAWNDPMRTQNFVNTIRTLTPAPYNACAEFSLYSIQQGYSTCSIGDLACNLRRATELLQYLLGALARLIADTARGFVDRYVLPLIPASLRPSGSFWQTVDQFLNPQFLLTLARKLWTRGREIGMKLFEALGGALIHFIRNLQKPLWDWLLGPIDVANDVLPLLKLQSIITSGLNLNEILGLVLDTLGISWDRIIQAAVEELYNSLPGGVVAFLQIIETLLNNAVPGGAMETGAMAGGINWEALKDWIPAALENLPQQFFNVFLEQLPNIGIQLALWLASLVPGPGWVLGIVRTAQSLWRTASYIISNWEDIEAIFTGFIGIARSLLTDLNSDDSTYTVAQIQSQISGLLDITAPKLIGILASFLGVQGLVSAVHSRYNTVVGTVRNAVPNAVRAALTPLTTFLSNRGFGATDKPLTPPVALGGDRELYLEKNGTNGVQVRLKIGTHSQRITINAQNLNMYVAPAGQAIYNRLVNTEGPELVTALNQVSQVNQNKPRPGVVTSTTRPTPPRNARAATVNAKNKGTNTIAKARPVCNDLRALKNHITGSGCPSNQMPGQGGTATGCSLTGSCWTAGTGWHDPRGVLQDLDRPALGRRVQCYGADEQYQFRVCTDPGPQPGDENSYCHLVCRLQKSAQDYVDLELLRPKEWAAQHIGAGNRCYVDLPEQGLEGYARILALKECPPLEAGPGRLITGWFRHSRAMVFDLKLASESKPLGVTATHLIWSVDRWAWVPVIQLVVGERVKTLAGTTVVEWIKGREKLALVYNIEVEGDHCYRVGEGGILVHNQSIPCQGLGFGYANARWQNPPYARYYLRAQNHPNAPNTLVTFTRSVTVRLNRSNIVPGPPANGGTIAANLAQALFYGGLFYWYDTAQALATNAPIGPIPYERARVGHQNDDSAGHIIPRVVGGRGDLPPSQVSLSTNNTRNIFAQEIDKNNRDYPDIWGHANHHMQLQGAYAHQATIYDLLEHGCDLCVRITLTYPTGSAPVHPFPFTEGGPRPYRPTRITVTVYLDGQSTNLYTRWWSNP